MVRFALSRQFGPWLIKLKFLVFNKCILTMYNDSSAYTKDKDMRLAELDFDPTDDTDMLSAANSDEYQQPIVFMDSIDDFQQERR